MESFSCPLPITDYQNILLAHGGGGKLSAELIQKMFLPQLKNPFLEILADGAVLPIKGKKIAFSTDSYVISPIFFPGGDIGELAINGTINDIAMCGGLPVYISVGFIIEEGLPIDDLWKIVQSIKRAADKTKVKVVTGDTKVVDKGKCDKIFINTSGIGIVPKNVNVGPHLVKTGDKIIVNGEIGNHGIAVMAVREGLEFETKLVSDSASLSSLVQVMLKASKNIHCFRDPTRGGVSSSLNEIAKQSNLGIEIDEVKIPVSEAVKGACEILGFDPLYVANEGKLLAFVKESDAGKILKTMKKHPLGKNSSIIGEVTKEHKGKVVLKSLIGGKHILDMLTGEQLPRIC